MVIYKKNKTSCSDLLDGIFESAPAERTGKTVSGYLEYNGRIVKVDSLDAVKRFVADIE